MNYSFGSWVKKRRKALDLTQKELAREVGCSASLIFKIESDERRPSRQIAGLLAEKLNIPPEQSDLFLKIARQEKGITYLDNFTPPVNNEPVPYKKRESDDLPVPPTTLLGRDHEVNAISHQLRDPACRMLTLTGQGGIGKTRLAIEAGRQLKAYFPDGVYFVSLAGVGMIESIIPAVAETLGMAFSGPARPIEQIAANLDTKNVLLVIDNMEHLVEGADVLGEILQNARQVKILLTSREPMRLQWEWLFEVQGLPIPENTDANLENNSAFSLFTQRASQTSQTFSMDAEDVEAVVQICQLVGGLPLAIELAASLVRILSCREIAQELGQTLDLLETKKLDVPPRHRSLKAVFDHSWGLLTDGERTVLKRLSVFRGGFRRDAAIDVAETDLSLLSSLVEKSLLRFNRTRSRYDLHEVIRQYAFSRLQSDPDDLRRASERHAAYFADWIAGLESSFKSAQQRQTSQLIRSETSNWLAGWHWATEHLRLDILRKMSPCLNWYFEVHGYYDEALSVFAAALEKFRASGAPENLKSASEKSSFAGLVDQVGWFEFRKGDTENGAALLAESLDIAQGNNDPEILYYIYGNWGYLALMQGQIPEASRLTKESLKYAKILNSSWHTAIPINVLGIVAYQKGDLTEAHQQMTESLQHWRSVGDPRGLVFCMLHLGMTTYALRGTEETRTILQESNAIAKTNKDRWAQAFGLDLLGMVALEEDRNEEALACFRESISLYGEIGDQMNAMQPTIHLGQTHAAFGSKDEAKRLLLEAYANARENNWKVINLRVLVSFVEITHELPPETKLAVVLSVISHPSATPYMHERCARMRDAILPGLTAEQTNSAENLAKSKTPEEWAQEVLK